jgi:large conductance mechanosensitive channel
MVLRNFLDEFMSFAGVGLSLYLIAIIYGIFSRGKGSMLQEKTKCQYCRKPVPPKAIRCNMCTSWLDGREDRETSALPVHD